MIWILGGIFIVATVLFIGLWFGAALLYDMFRARHKRILHTTAADERIMTAERRSMDQLRSSMLPPRQERPLAELPPFIPHAVPDVPVNHPPLPAPVVALLGHATVDELVDSIVMRAVTSALIHQPG